MEERGFCGASLQRGSAPAASSISSSAQAPHASARACTSAPPSPRRDRSFRAAKREEVSRSQIDLLIGRLAEHDEEECPRRSWDSHPTRALLDPTPTSCPSQTSASPRRSGIRIQAMCRHDLPKTPNTSAVFPSRATSNAAALAAACRGRRAAIPRAKGGQVPLLDLGIHGDSIEWPRGSGRTARPCTRTNCSWVITMRANSNIPWKHRTARTWSQAQTATRPGDSDPDKGKRQLECRPRRLPRKPSLPSLSRRRATKHQEQELQVVQ